MATVCKVTRTVIFPPQFKSLQEWFHYAFANSQIDGMTFKLTSVWVNVLVWLFLSRGGPVSFTGKRESRRNECRT